MGVSDNFVPYPHECLITVSLPIVAGLGSLVDAATSPPAPDLLHRVSIGALNGLRIMGFKDKSVDRQ